MADQDNTSSTDASVFAQNQAAAESTGPLASGAVAATSTSTGSAQAAQGVAESDTPTTTKVHTFLEAVKDDFHEWFEDGERDAAEIIAYLKSKI